MSPPFIVIHWFRRDLRLTDNTALWAAAAVGNVIPVIVLSDRQKRYRWTGSARQEFFCESLAALAANLNAIGSRLIVRRGDAVQELSTLVREVNARGIFYNEALDPHGRDMERRLKIAAKEAGFEVHGYGDSTLHHPGEILTSVGGPFRVFTPYYRAWNKLFKKKSIRGAVRFLGARPTVASLSLPHPEDWKLSGGLQILPGGEHAARRRLEKFLDRKLEFYGEERDFPAEECTSRISQDLRFGLLSIREVFNRAENRIASFPATRRKNAERYLAELAWREFYFQILWHFPEVLEREFQPKFQGMTWFGKVSDFDRWCAGETGFPIVDAGMRELAQTGFMHNRVRMITAMFLTKDLRLDWRLGESWFMRHLTDGEIASNNGGWQWSAGTGADAAPYFRIQNPWTQTSRFDPTGKYIQKWVPELRNVPPTQFCKPSETSLVRGYPIPMVNHGEARHLALKMFRVASG